MNHTYSILVLFGYRILIPSKDFIFYKRNLYGSCAFWIIMHIQPVLKDSNILKFPDKIALENCIFIKNYFNQTLPTPFKNWFTLSTDSHTHNTRWSNLGCLKIPPHKTTIYGRQSVNISVIYTWNYLQSHHRNIMFHQLSFTRLKKLIMQYYFSNYD